MEEKDEFRVRKAHSFVEDLGAWKDTKYCLNCLKM
jgi:hypothetical protein